MKEDPSRCYASEDRDDRAGELTREEHAAFERRIRENVAALETAEHGEGGGE